MKCQCEFCKKIFTVDDQHAGKNANCPNCLAAITIKEYIEIEEIKFSLSPWNCFWHNVTKNYCNFEGRVGRREFWFFQLFAFLSEFCAGIITFPFSGFLGWVLTLVLFLPRLGITIRRFHDINQSASFVISLFVLSLILFIPTIGILGSIPAIIMFIFSCIKGNTQTNRYGEPPQA